MTRFDYCLARVLEYEGGWADNPKDPGGPTMKGITYKVYAQYLGIPIPQKGTMAYNSLKVQLLNIPDSHIADIYRHNYWDMVRGDYLPAGLDQAAFDFAVNSGWSRSAKYLQRTLGFPEKDVDGLIGPKTLAAIKLANTGQLIRDYITAREAFLKSLDGFAHFGKGWIARTTKLERQALAAVASAHA